VKTLRAAHESWNKRDFAGVIDNAAASTCVSKNTTPLWLFLSRIEITRLPFDSDLP